MQIIDTCIFTRIYTSAYTVVQTDLGMLKTNISVKMLKRHNHILAI